MTPESLRQAFEAWAKSQCLPTYRWSSDGPYGSITQSAWVAWQACYERMGQLPATEYPPGDAWEDNARYLLDRCPHTIRYRPGAGMEELLHSFVLTFMSMEQKLKRSAPPPPGEKL